MKKIFIRSPYFIEINQALQVGSKVELFIWNIGTDEPVTPTYILSKKIPSATQTNTIYNISNYAKEFIKQINTEPVSSPTEESNLNWCYVKVKRYEETVTGTFELIDTETFVALNGYTRYSDGYNYFTEDGVVPLFNTGIKKYVKDFNSIYVNVFFEVGDYDTDNGTIVETFSVLEPGLYKIPITSDKVLISQDGVGQLYSIKAEQLCEPKYTPITCTFINRFGGWEFITFFKANTQSIETTNKEFNLLPSGINYNVLQGQKQTFNQQGKQKIKCNTGWVNENYFELIQDLLLSETVLLDNKPVIVKSQSSDYKTHLKDKNINYEIDFEFNYGLINDVI
jgi:hypothetical protein